MTTTEIKAWLRQSSTVNGIGLFIGVAAGAVAHVMTHDTTDSVAVGTVAAAIVHLIMPGNSAAETSVAKFASDILTAVEQKRVVVDAPELLADGLAVVQAVQAPVVVVAPPPGTVTTTTTTAPVAPLSSASTVGIAVPSGAVASNTQIPVSVVGAGA